MIATSEEDWEAARKWAISRLCLTRQYPPELSCPGNTTKCSCVDTLADAFATIRAEAAAAERYQHKVLKAVAYALQYEDKDAVFRSGTKIGHLQRLVDVAIRARSLNADKSGGE